MLSKCLESRHDAWKEDVFKRKYRFQIQRRGHPLVGILYFMGMQTGTACRRLIATTSLRFPSFLVKIVLRPPFKKG